MVNPSVQPNGHKPEAAQSVGSEQASVRRDVLPIPDVKHVGLTTYDAKAIIGSYSDSHPPARPQGLRRQMLQRCGSNPTIERQRQIFTDTP